MADAELVGTEYRTMFLQLLTAFITISTVNVRSPIVSSWFSSLLFGFLLKMCVCPALKYLTVG